MTSSLSVVISSMVLFACVTSLIAMCTSCKKMFKRKNKSDKLSKENSEIIPSENPTLENGVNNPAYDATNQAEGNEKAASLKEEQTEESKSNFDQENDFPDNDHLNGDAVKTENECNITAKNSRDISSHGNSFEQADKAENKIEENTENTSDKEETPSHAEEQMTNTNVSEDVEISINPHRFSESIKSRDVAYLSVALDDKAKTISEEEDASYKQTSDEEDISNPDFSRFRNAVLMGGWRRNVKLIDLLEMKMIKETTAQEILKMIEELKGDSNDALNHDALKPFVIGEDPIAGILFSETGETRSLFRSAKDGILRRGTAISLLEAQAATGNIIDPKTGRKMSVSEGVQLGLLDKVYETVVSRAERAVTGYKNRLTDEVMSLGQAMERGLVTESHGIRLLEAQVATGGIIDHRANVRIPLNIAVTRGLLNQKTADRLSLACEDVADEQKATELKTFFDPNTEENVTYCELMRRSVIDDNTGMRLYPLEKVGRKKFNPSNFSARSSLSSSRTNSKDNIPTEVEND